MEIEPFFHKPTATFSYIVYDEPGGTCAVIDPVLDYAAESATTSTEFADKLIDFIHSKKLTVEWLLETHIHADHLTAASYLQENLGGKIGVSEKITDVLAYWVPLLGTEADTPMDGSQFDHLFGEGETFEIGSLEAEVIATPGHTPACISYHIGDAVFIGDTLFQPYMGTSRADFPGGSARQLYASIKKLYALPDDTRLFTGHDYPPAGQQASGESTVAQQKQSNIMLNDATTEKEYCSKRNERDASLNVPKLLLPSIQINLRAGKMGDADENGVHYIKLPLNSL